ncbi:MAG: hypothetical protein ACLFWB_10365 [Armatimonadota bacterium]
MPSIITWLAYLAVPVALWFIVRRLMARYSTAMVISVWALTVGFIYNAAWSGLMRGQYTHLHDVFTWGLLFAPLLYVTSIASAIYALVAKKEKPRWLPVIPWVIALGNLILMVGFAIGLYLYT